MFRKLFSMLLCAFALLLLMGASLEPETSLLAEEESAADSGEVSEAAPQPEELTEPVRPDIVHALQGTNPLKLAEGKETSGMEDITGSDPEPSGPAQSGQSNSSRDQTYVSLAAVAQELDPTASVSWKNNMAKVTTDKLTLTARVGDLYLEANGRYLYLPEGVQLSEGRVEVPLWAVAKAFDAQVTVDASTGALDVVRGSGAIQSGDAFYDAEELFWLSRIITAESGNQPMEGQIGVGIVVMNRVASSIYPDTVEEVLAQKNQFTTYRGGRLADRTPKESCVIAAKIVLDGGMVEGLETALYFDSTESSWAARNKECVASIGNHKFYGG